MSAPKPLTKWQLESTPSVLPRHIRRNIGAGENGCWFWLRSCSPDGYGWASFNDRTYQAHRLVYSLVNSPPPPELILDHLCRVRHCVNPAHLEPVTTRENLRRGNTPTGWDHCQRCGSEYMTIGKHRQRRCLRCKREYDIAWGQRERHAGR